MGRPLNLDILPVFLGHFEDILGNHGEIPHIG